MQNIAHLIRDSAQGAPNLEAIVCGEQRLTYEGLWDGVSEACSGFLNCGIRHGERIAIFLEKRVETVLAMFGAAAAGATFIPINPLLKPDQVAHILRDSGARLLVTSPVRAHLLAGQLGNCGDLTTLILTGGGSTPRELKLTCLKWSEAMAGAGRFSGQEAIDEDVAAILYTSGSTGLPKGVVLSHRNLIEGARSVVEYIGNTAEDRILSLLPLSFDAGLSQLTTAFAARACVVLLNYLRAEDIPELCGRERITGITGVPPLWAQLVRANWSPDAREGLRYCANTGGRMLPTTLAAMRSLFPQAKTFLMYGLTEAFRSTYLDPQELDARPDSIGKAIPNARILVVGPEGEPCLPGEIGELVHVGANVALGYLNRPELTAERFRPSPEPCPPGVRPPMAVWSGDLVRTDEDGFLYFVGRRDNMIKTSGYRVSPTEIEAVVSGTGLVVEAAAFGIENEELGQAIAVAVVSGPSGSDILGDLRAACRAKLPAYMVPHHFLMCDVLPRGPNGKYDYAAIAAAGHERVMEAIDGTC